MKTIARIFSNKPCTMIVNSSEVKVLKTNKICCLDIKVDISYKIEFIIQKNEIIDKTLTLSLTPNSACSTYIISVDWGNENISCFKDNTDPTYRHLKMDDSNKPHCFIYDAKNFSLFNGIDVPYEFIEDFSTAGLARVKYNNHYGVIDRNCKIIIPIEYSEISTRLDSNYIFAHKYGDSYMFTNEGELVFKRENYWFSNLKGYSRHDIIEANGLIKIMDPESNLQGYINLNNEIVIRPRYGGINKFNDNDNLFIVNAAWRHGGGVIDINENIILSFSYESIFPIKRSNNDGYIYVVCYHVENSTEKYYLIIDSSENRIIDEQFEDFKFYDETICLLKENKWYFYNKDLLLFATYPEEDVRIWKYIGINIRGKWLPLDIAMKQ